MEQQKRNYGLTKSKEEKNTEEEFINPLPRAVLRTNSYILLDGEWRFALDVEDRGLQEKWYLDHSYELSTHWPGTVEEYMGAAKGQQAEKFSNDKVVAWYEREFPAPKLSNENYPHSIIQLTFGACGYETTVWLNGILLHTIEGEEVHTGEYTSFSYELNQENFKEQNRLTVRIADTMDADIPRGKQESSVYKRGGIWYHTFTGAVRSIWLETVERNRFRSRVGVVSIVEDNMVRFNLTTRIHDPGNYVIRITIFNKKQQNAEPVAVDEFPIRLEKGEKRQRFVVEIPGAKLWSPETPHLYTLIAHLIDENGYGASIETHFGLRKIEARGKVIYLNNKKSYLDGILYQPGTASYEEIKRHIYSMKELVANNSK